MIREVATIADVAREAKVSVSTASRVLRGVLQVLPETRSRILAAAERLGYQANPVARALRLGQPRGIALVASAEALRSPLYSNALSRLSQALSASEFQLMVIVQDNPSLVRTGLEALKGWCGALAVEGQLLNHDTLAQVVGIALPLTVIEPICDPAQLPSPVASIRFDPFAAADQIISHLTSLGHRNIAWIDETPESWIREEKRNAYEEAMKRHGLPVRPELLIQCNSNSEQDAVATALDHALSDSRCRLTALTCSTDALALRVIGHLKSWRRTVPQEFSIVGYGNTPKATYSSPALTTIDRRGTLLGDALADQLLESLSSSESRARHILLPPNLVVRDSTVPLASTLSFAGSFPGKEIAFPVERPGGDERARQILDGIYELEALHSGMALEVPYCVRGQGGALWQWEKNGSVAQLWHIEHTGDGWHRIRNVGNWLYADSDAEVLSVTPVVIKPLSLSAPDHQLWSFDAVDDRDDRFQIINRAKELAMDVAHASRLANALVLTFFSKEGDNQKWVLRRVPFLSGDYELVALHSSMALDLPGNSRASGTIPFQQPRARSLGQRWKLIHRGNQLYTIQSKLSGLNLQSSGLPGSSVVLAPADPDAAEMQLWRFELVNPDIPAWEIVTTAGLALEIAASSHSAGAELTTSPSSTSHAQQWLVFDDCSY